MASIVKVDKIAQASGTPEFTIPTVDGAANTFLKTDGSGVLSFGAVSAGVALTGSTNTWIPTITGSDALTGTANFTYDGSILDVKNSGTASSVKLYCESSNAHYQEIKAAPHSGSSNWTLTLPPTVPSSSGQVLSATTAGVASWADAGGGKVLQVVQTVKTDVFSSSSVNDTWSAVTGLSVDITPSLASSKILVQYTVNVSMATGSHSGVATGIYRDGTLIPGAKASSLSGSQEAVTTVTTHYNADDANTQNGVASMMYLDSPSTTSATTYQVYLFNASGSAFVSYVNRTMNDGTETYVTRGVSSITVMEIGV